MTSCRSATNIPTEQNTPTLESSNEVVTVIKNDYCCGKEGKKHYEGKSMPLSIMRFDEGTKHEKVLHEFHLSNDPHERFFAFFQYASGNFELLSIARFVEGQGFVDHLVSFCTDGQDGLEHCSENVAHGASLPSIDVDGSFETKYYSIMTGMFRYTIWKYEAGIGHFVAQKSWDKTYDEEQSVVE
jgi:hypothetical protein